MPIKRLQKRIIPEQLKREGRLSELLGEIKDNTMFDCVYNSIVAGDYNNWKPNKVENVLELVPTALKSGSFRLKDYQVDDLAKALTQNVVFNINKPGYGKTLETILWIYIVLKKDFKVLILCPKSVIETWKHQLDCFWPNWASYGTWWITNYEQLYNEERFKIALDFTWDLIVLDESHTIKSMKSKITQIVYKLKSKCRHCLTGTPIKNRPEDIASQLKWLDNYSITCYTDFQFAFCEMYRDNFGWKSLGLTKNLKMVNNLQKLLDLYCVGGVEHNLSTLQKPEYIKVRLPLDNKVKSLYKKIEGEKFIDTEGLLKEGIKVSSAIEAATRRQQLTSNPQLFNSSLKNVKFEWISDWLEGTNEKVIILSKYAKTIDTLEILLKKNKKNFERIKREQNVQKRKESIESWKKDKQVLLGTFGVLGEGVDGLQESCRYIVFIDREWTASANEQAERRIYRLGQRKQPIIYILQAIGTIDIRIERIQLDKGHDAKELLEPVAEHEI